MAYDYSKSVWWNIRNGNGITEEPIPERVIPLKDIDVELLAHQCLCGYAKEDIVKTIDLMELFVKMGAMQNYIQFDLGNAYVTIELKESED